MKIFASVATLSLISTALPAVGQELPAPPARAALLRNEVDATGQTVAIEKLSRMRLDEKGRSSLSINAFSVSVAGKKTNGFLLYLFDTKVENRLDLRIDSAGSFEVYCYIDEDEASPMLRALADMIKADGEKDKSRSRSIRFSGKEGFSVVGDFYPERTEFSIYGSGSMVSSTINNNNRQLKVTLHGSGELKKLSDYILKSLEWFQGHK